ncbi:MAG: hypothetical protein ABIJ74_01095 [archaeon]
MKRILVIALVLIILFFSGCSQNEQSNNGSNSTSAPDSKNKALCGNGIAETGENYENCCLDVECPEFFSCKEIEQGKNKINTCVKAKLEETKEYKNFITYLGEETAEYEKESGVIDYDYILTKIEQMDRAIKKLDGVFDVTIEKRYVQYRYNRREWNIKKANLSQKFTEATDEDKQKEIFEQIITLDKEELQRLKSFAEEEIDKINSKFDYDILEKQSYLESLIPEEEKFLENWKEGYQIEIEVIDYKPYCSSYSNECYLEYVKLSIKNNGELNFDNPAFDFYIYKGDQVISRDIDKSISDTEIAAGFNGVYKETYIGYDSKEDIQPGTYTLKVNLKRGITTNAVATTSKTINLK